MTNATPSGPDPRPDAQPVPDYRPAAPPPYPATTWTGRARWLRPYRQLRARAEAHSLTWWGFMVVQGLVFGAALASAGLLWYLALVVAADTPVLGRIGVMLIVLGVIVFLRYLAAPITARWVVTVPPRRYYVVEDNDTTFEYLEPGRMVVPWRWRARVVPYVDFNAITLLERIENVLDSEELPVDLDVRLTMYFNPTYADDSQYETLRDYTRQAQFEAMLADTVRDVVYEHLARLRLVGGDPVPLDVKTLETVIVDGLAGFEAIGLIPASDRPVTVTVSAPPEVRQAYQAIWTQGARARSDAEIMREVEHVAADFDVPFDEALQLFFLLQRGTPTPRALRENLTPEGPSATASVPPAEPAPATVSAESTASTPPEGVPAAPADAPLPDAKWTTPRVVADPTYTADPAARRRERKRQRRSRRAED